MNTKVKTYFSPKRIAYLGVMTAIAVITNCFTVTVNSGANSISFNYVICSLAGIFFGPISGGIVGLLGDLIGCLIAPKGPFNPFIMVASGLIGVLSGLAFNIPKLNVYLKIILAYVFIFIVCTLGLNTFGLWFFYAKGKKSFLIYLVGRAPFQAINIAINIVITYVLYVPLKKFVFDKWDVTGKKAVKSIIEEPKIEETEDTKEN
ncbi:MAG: folate family ECF transporter S component [Clostridia bacterium]|nr:folate family ECF transporter S component [Clostridia bacterium]